MADSSSSSSSSSFVVPVKKISLPVHLQQFHQSQTYSHFLNFVVVDLNDSVKHKKISEEGIRVISIVEKMLKALETCKEWVALYPPLQQTMRYGNKAFRSWFQHLVNNASLLMKEILPEALQDAAVELSPYFWDSMGNPTRIDYGTGHETTFVAWLYCFRLLNLVTPEDYPALVLKVFAKYIDLMRFVQSTYMLEPAGSHGVWSLDDYQFLPFLWGSSQLLDHKYISPKLSSSEDVYDVFAKDFLYLAGIQFINKMKTGPFFEHSPILHQATSVPHWLKVNQVLTNMYKNEVLGKFPIMQHFLFGSLISFEPSTSGAGVSGVGGPFAPKAYPPHQL